MNRTAVEEIKARLPIEEIIGSYTKLEKAGKSFKARCPFHNEKSPSFFVSPDRGGYYCFGCGAKGDIFTFVEQFEGLDFRGALKILAEKAGVQLTYDTKADSERDRLYQVMEEAARYFETQLGNNKIASDYVLGRGINDDTRKLFRIGFAPEGWRNLLTYLKGKGFDEILQEKAGLIKKKDTVSNLTSATTVERATSVDFGDAKQSQTKTLRRREEGVVPVSGTSPSKTSTSSSITNSSNVNYYDRFRGRVMFPISDSSGRVIAFSGRILKDDGQLAKYLNSPDTPLYDKSLVLYGLDKAKAEIRRLNYVILVEGQMDLVMSHQAGIKNTVASSGTALTDETAGSDGAVSNLALVRRLSPNVIIAFDSDNAGRKAAMRASGIALKMAMDVKIADIVGGKDPADLVKDDIEKWKNVLRTAKPVVEFELSNTVREVTDSRKLAKAITERVLPILAQIESASDQSFFVQMIADRAKIPVDIVWQDLKVVEKRLKQTTPVNSISTKSMRTSGEQSKRIDIVERRLFGLIFLMKKDKLIEVNEYEVRLSKIAGDSYEKRKERTQALADDLIFEAETFFGNDKELWKKQIEELLVNFEEDMISEELVSAMQELKVAEQNHDSVLLSELAKKCQVLSLRKAEVGKKRRM